MANHPRPAILASSGRQVCDRIDDEGDKAIRRAAILAARGWPTSTNGTDGGRTADPTSSTERAALTPGPFDDIDNRLARQLRLWWYVGRQIHDTFDLIMAHAPDDDQIPPGTGRCQVVDCGHVCNPRKNPNDRLRAGFCFKHYQRWLREGRPDRGRFIRFAETAMHD